MFFNVFIFSYLHNTSYIFIYLLKDKCFACFAWLESPSAERKNKKNDTWLGSVHVEGPHSRKAFNDPFSWRWLQVTGRHNWFIGEFASKKMLRWAARKKMQKVWFIPTTDLRNEKKHMSRYCFFRRLTASSLRRRGNPSSLDFRV